MFIINMRVNRTATTTTDLLPMGRGSTNSRRTPLATTRRASASQQQQQQIASTSSSQTVAILRLLLVFDYNLRTDRKNKATTTATISYVAVWVLWRVLMVTSTCLTLA